ncbi:MAG: 30S ribosome-binding factor RbfA [Dehalobacter sp. 4CP]|jgi:ribosome-binding factor A|uniref:Ribosome-binding factor A n=2 Tax=Dehalobacter restrictus TaxID=55583 RepID=A0A857DHW8_9FIRM|nr:MULTISPECIES: 30S ribosome-binding factor RbfA [Dehalobacter]NBJ15587.1 30S ribosome-binding factor RbfA [Dehalobacter sp. 4CP]AFV03096.1 Ribosome-binding factor A [Dehalobacter sp. DCA]AFV06084.1 Ribosome-binding factor A [Dehalobacter sp. CF]AHF09625.1 ribosome-binding factor A [Dehalobacter restrictus DSM 9455]EQB21266.1 Ribosome-binding protein factor A [Dehalobacter sp. UNSWDHB]
MAKHRAFRLAESIKAEVAQMIREDIKDPRLGFVTVTDVEVADDLRHAKIFVSVLGTEEEMKSSLDVLNKASGYLRSELGKIISLRYFPEITFKYDQSIEHGAHISKLLREVGAKGESSDGQDDE